jgi:hypothetical protein
VLKLEDRFAVVEIVLGKHRIEALHVRFHLLDFEPVEFIEIRRDIRALDKLRKNRQQFGKLRIELG